MSADDEPRLPPLYRPPSGDAPGCSLTPTYVVNYIGADPQLRQRLGGLPCRARRSGALLTLVQGGSHLGTCTPAEVLILSRA
jgi:hypothetical protein